MKGTLRTKQLGPREQVAITADAMIEAAEALEAAARTLRADAKRLREGRLLRWAAIDNAHNAILDAGAAAKGLPTREEAREEHLAQVGIVARAQFRKEASA